MSRSGSTTVAAVAVAALSLVAALPLLACPREEGRPSRCLTTAAGKVEVVSSPEGGEPQITDASGKRWLLAGGLRGELARLQGHKISVHGHPGDRKLETPTIVVHTYQILDAGGGRPEVGNLGRAGDRWVLTRAKDDVLAIAASPALAKRLARHAGCKVWVLGTVEGKTIKAHAYGWLRCTSARNTTPKKEDSR